MPTFDVPAMAKPVTKAASSVRKGATRQAGAARRGAATLATGAALGAKAAVPSSLRTEEKRRSLALERVAFAIRAAQEAKGKPSKVTPVHKAALAALNKAAAEMPGDDELIRMADELMAASAAALKSAGSEVSQYGHQKNPALQALQVVHDGTHALSEQRFVAMAKDAHVDAYFAAGKAGKLTELSRKNFLAPTVVDTSAFDKPKGPKTEKYYVGRDYRGAVAYWLAYKGSKEDAPGAAAKEAKEALGQLAHIATSAKYEEIVRELGQDHAAKHGLREGELAAIATYTGGDYLKINPARAQIKGWNMSAPHDVHKDTDQLKNQADYAQKNGMKDKGFVNRELAVLQNKTNREQGNKEFDSWFAATQKKDFQRPAPTDPAIKKAREDVLGLARESNLNTVRNQAALTSEIAVRGLSRLPRWKGKAWRADKLDHARLARNFQVVDTGRESTSAWST